MTTALAASAALVSLAFAFSTYERWLLKRRRYELTWTIAFGCFCLGALSLAWGSAAGWSGASFRTFYLFGAIVNVPFLAVGQVELLSSRRWVQQLRPAVALLSAAALGVLVSAPLRAPVPSNRLPQGSEVFGALPRILAAICSAGGAMVVFGGAAWSTAALLRQRRARTDAVTARLLGRRAIGTGLITLGTIVLSTSGTLNKRFGEMTAFAITLTAGVCILFVGFLVTTLPAKNDSGELST